MGYYSDVVVAIKKKEIVNFNLHLAHATNSDYEALLDFLSAAQQTDLAPDEDRVVYVWKSIKWYITFINPEAIQDALEELPDYSYAFIRIGEEDEDIEVLGDPWALGVELVRSFTF